MLRYVFDLVALYLPEVKGQKRSRLTWQYARESLILRGFAINTKEQAVKTGRAIRKYGQMLNEDADEILVVIKELASAAKSDADNNVSILTLSVSDLMAEFRPSLR